MPHIIRTLFCVAFMLPQFTVTLYAQQGWHVEPSGVSELLFDVHFADTLAGWTVGRNGTLLATTDGGATWTSQSIETSWDLWAVDFVSRTEGWIAGQSSMTFPPDSGIILKTTDGGGHWSRQLFAIPFYGIDFIDSLTGWCVGVAGAVIKTTDGGVSWSPHPVATALNFYDVAFVDGNVGWAVGGYEMENLIRKTTDGGTTWLPESSSSNRSFLSISAVDSLHAWASGAAGAYRTSDGGATWEHLSLASSDVNPVATVFFVDGSTGWAGGGYGPYVSRIYRTTDAGTTWDSQYVPTTNEILRLHFTDAWHGWGVGMGGVILGTADGGITAVAGHAPAEAPVGFALEQNYPNPFNPSTTITYVLPSASQVKLVIVDALGRNVATLVDRFEHKGEQRVVVDASKLPSGMYFYRLSAGGKTFTRKMALIR